MKNEMKVFNLKVDLTAQVINILLESFPEWTFEQIHNSDMLYAAEQCLNKLIDQLSTGMLEKIACEHCNGGD